MDDFVNGVKRHAAQMDTSRAHGQMGIVVSYDPATATAKVNLQPENVISGWLPVLYPTVAASGGVISPPYTGQQVFVNYEGGSKGSGVVMGGIYSDQSVPPNGATGMPVQSGEFAVIYGNSLFHMLANGNIVFKAGNNTMTLSPNGLNINIQTGQINVTSNIMQTGSHTSTGDQIANGISQTMHVHGGVQSGSSNTGLPQG
jgi:phage baseplate assembly protein V